jgi:hypothetical protein
MVFYTKYKKNHIFYGKLEVNLLNKKYVIFKNDDVGKDTPKLKKLIDTVLENNAKVSIGLIGKYLKDERLVKYLNSLDNSKIEIFCHGYYHYHLPYITAKLKWGKKPPNTEFNKDFKKHDNSLKKYRELEKKYLKTKAVTFGPQGNIWNENILDALIKNDFKIMFSWKKVPGKIFTVPLSSNYYQNSLEEFKKEYNTHNNDEIFTFQFHHADLSDIQFELLHDIIDFLKNHEKRLFVTPYELSKIVNR